MSRLRQKDPLKAKAVTRQSVSRHRQKDPLKARMNIKQYVAHYRVKNPLAKTREAVRKRVSRHYHENITKSRDVVNKRVKQCYHRFISRTSTARQYMKDLLESCTKSRYTSSMAYRKKTEAIHRGKRDRYSLAEPKKVKVTCLIKHFQDTFSADKKITSNSRRPWRKSKLTSSQNADLQLNMLLAN